MFNSNFTVKSIFVDRNNPGDMGEWLTMTGGALYLAPTGTMAAMSAKADVPRLPLSVVKNYDPINGSIFIMDKGLYGDFTPEEVWAFEAHEHGHLENRHHPLEDGLTPLERELQADRWAAYCLGPRPLYSALCKTVVSTLKTLELEEKAEELREEFVNFSTKVLSEDIGRDHEIVIRLNHLIDMMK